MLLQCPITRVRRRYYRDVLGFNVQWHDVPDWRLFMRDSCVIMSGMARYFIGESPVAPGLRRAKGKQTGKGEASFYPDWVF